MQFKMIHENYNVFDLEKSAAFYKKALGLHEVRRKPAEDGSFIILYMADDSETFELELTWIRTDDYEAAHRLHEEMGCICFENPKMGIYFIQDPDGYWLEILPAK